MDRMHEIERTSNSQQFFTPAALQLHLRQVLTKSTHERLNAFFGQQFFSLRVGGDVAFDAGVIGLAV